MVVADEDDDDEIAWLASVVDVSIIDRNGIVVAAAAISVADAVDVVVASDMLLGNAVGVDDSNEELSWMLAFRSSRLRSRSLSSLDFLRQLRSVQQSCCVG